MFGRCRTPNVVRVVIIVDPSMHEHKGLHSLIKRLPDLRHPDSPLVFREETVQTGGIGRRSTTLNRPAAVRRRRGHWLGLHAGAATGCRSGAEAGSGLQPKLQRDGASLEHLGAGAQRLQGSVGSDAPSHQRVRCTHVHGP